MVRDVDEGAGFVGADLVEENGGARADDDVAVAGSGERGVYEFEAVEFGGRGRGMWVVVFAELGGIAVGYYGEGAEVLWV